MTARPEPSLTEVDRIAARFHQGQRDKAGHPYIGHPRAAAAGGSLYQQVAALLHDVVEDTEATLPTLRDLGIPEPVIVLVDAMTKRPGESHEYYLHRVAGVPGATLIKRADIAHNSGHDRLGHLPPAVRNRLRTKYARALRLLDRPEGR